MTAELSPPRRPGRSLSSNLGAWLGKTIRRSIPTAIALFILLGIWQLVCSGDNAPLPGPIQLVQDTWDLIIDPFYRGSGTDQGLFWQIAASLQRVAVGYLLAAIAGIALGILIGVSVLMFQAIDPIFQVLRTVPPLAWLPISLAAFRDSQPAAIFVIFITAIWPIIINTAVGVQNIPQDYNNVARVLKLSRLDYFFKVLLPATVPYIFTGLKIAIGLSWLAIVAAEMLTGGVGIGFFIWDAYNSGSNSEVILAIIYVGLVGLLLNALIGFIASRVVPEEQK
ncbi:nitrate ABC transporter permease [Thermoleptolyngbya sp. M55_K2018_002]|uniref:nitrate ABC transporter permease n=1 Tax=Thermoleptolyngbya sp. M55_K2018_002 TaxID=2747808 RepID=UPI0019E51134|nr:nitrate ABC transporter permease [Thermoleptolyngbya sp. M55_K2018_002]HIK43130.1 nitrate ABC transporter permease [Thermoleptolyngbya sp. M55_K2018_002]